MHMCMHTRAAVEQTVHALTIVFMCPKHDLIQQAMLFFPFLYTVDPVDATIDIQNKTLYL